MTRQSFTDQSRDRAYRVETPQIAHALFRTPQDATLWLTIKMIAGETGECYLGTNDLAALAMMSPGKVNDSRLYLLAVGLLEGEKRVDPGYSQAVWHLSIPDLWPANVTWRQNNNSLKGRAAFKRYQQAELKTAGCYRAFDEAAYFESETLAQLTVKGLGELSQYESNSAQNEGELSQYELERSHCVDKETTKRINQQEQPKEIIKNNHVPTLADLTHEPEPTSVSQQAAKLWAKILQDLKNEFAAAQFHSLFGGSIGQDYAGGVLTVAWPSMGFERIKGYWSRGVGATIERVMESEAPGLSLEIVKGAT